MARWWRSPVVAVMILSCGVGLTGCMSKPPQAQERGKMAVPVKFEALEKGIQTTTTEYVGVLEADDAVTLKPEMDGMIQAILVQEGDTVQAGTPILVLKSDRDQASVQQAIANVEAAQAAEESAKAQLNAVKAEKEEAQADLTLKQQDLKRVQELVESGALPKRNLDQSRRDVDVAIARINTINQRIKAAEANINQAQATRRQVNNTVAIANEDLRETQVTAPVSGKIGDLSVKVGDYLERGSDIATITQNASLS